MIFYPVEVKEFSETVTKFVDVVKKNGKLKCKNQAEWDDKNECCPNKRVF